ncbi:MAG: hypothetical protein MAG794_01315 [Gammaproteobacteria bacterium]|nr:hypothetical protein [Gammaproteobacteria bacterium]
MINDNDKNNRKPWDSRDLGGIGRTGCFKLTLLGMGAILVCSPELFAQQVQFGIAPSARTQRAIGDSPTQSARELEGFYAEVGVAVSRSTNVRRVSENEEEDTAVIVSPSAGYRHLFGRHSAEVSIRSEFTRYSDLKDEDTDNYAIKGLTNLDITRILDLDLFASITDMSEPRGGIGTRLDQDFEPDELEIGSYGGAFTVGRRENRIQLKAGAERSQWRYQNNQQQFRNRDEDRYHGRVFYNISPRTSVFAGVSLTDVDFVRASGSPDSEELEYQIGGEWEIGAKTTGRVSVGRTEKDFDDPLLEDADATTWGGAAHLGAASTHAFRPLWIPAIRRANFGGR